MTDQNLVKGDPVYPQYARVKKYLIKGAATPTSFVKGELATFTSEGYLGKSTTVKTTWTSSNYERSYRRNYR